jgi:hypothetical protein
MEMKKNPNAKRQFFPLRCVMHPLCRSLKCCAFLQTIAPPALLHLFSQQTACGNRFFAPAARRDSKKIQPKGPRHGQKRMRKGVAELICSWVLFVRTEIPCLRPKRYAKLRSQSQLSASQNVPLPFLFCVFVQSSPQRLIKATYSPRPQGTKALEKGDLACAAVSTSSCLVLSSCSPQ